MIYTEMMTNFLFNFLNISSKNCLSLGLAAFFTAASSVLPAEDFTEEDYHRDAVRRLAKHHDPAMPMAIGALVVKQAGLIRVRNLLKQHGHDYSFGHNWNPKALEWKQAEATFIEIIDREISDIMRDPIWFENALYKLLIGRISAEEADEIAKHFESPTGSVQREIIDMSMIAETLQLAYTISRTIKPGVSGSEQEYKDLQKVWWDRRPSFAARENIYQDPAVRRFAGQETGRKYGRIMAMQGIGAIMNHIRMAVQKIEMQVDRNIPLIYAFGEDFLRRQEGL